MPPSRLDSRRQSDPDTHLRMHHFLHFDDLPLYLYMKRVTVAVGFTLPPSRNEIFFHYFDRLARSLREGMILLLAGVV